MRGNKSIITGIAVALIFITPVLFYFVTGRESIVDAYQGNAAKWVNFLTENIYPRFAAERQRLPLEFFLEKGDQIVIRYVLVILSAGLLFLLNKTLPAFRSITDSLTSSSTNVHQVNAIRIIVFILLLISARNIYEDLRALAQLQIFYKPVLILKTLSVPFPPKRVSFLIYGSVFLSSILVIFGIRPVLFSAVAAFGFILYQAFIYSFEKVDHGYGPFTYALIIMPFLLAEKHQAKKDNKEIFTSWSFPLILNITSLVYFLTGLEKLLIAGMDWLSPVAFRTYLHLHATEIGLRVAASDFLVYILPGLAIIFQLSFPAVLFFPKTKWIILAAGVLFHTGTVLFFGVSSFLNPWLFTYIFFFNWTKLGWRISTLPRYFRS